MTAQIIFWISFAALLHSYVLYPVILSIMAKGRKEKARLFMPDDDLPFVSVILSVHNESKAILRKLKSIYNTMYPLKRFDVLIGSDASTDNTDLICKLYSENYESLYFFPFAERKGKACIINSLVELARGEILILTDAQAFFEPETIYEIVKYFKDPSIDIVGGNIINEKVNIRGISVQEMTFMKREIRMKYLEGLIWGKTMGVYGAILAIRRQAFSRIPDNFAVDDFFITMKVLQKRRKVIINMNAVVKESVPGDIGEEFRRKVRISSGNFQNLSFFFRTLFPPWSSLAFIFLSHKVLRWTGPFFLLLMYFMSALLAPSSPFFRILFTAQTFLLFLPLIDIILRKLNFQSIILRFVTHFYAMNLALVVGFFHFLTGKKTGIWQPTNR